MIKAAVVSIIVLYFFALLQTSFFSYFSLFGVNLNLVLVAVILINIFEKTSGKIGIFSAFFGGLFLDIFSQNYLGAYVLALVAISIFIKYGLRKYVKIPAIG